MSMHFGLKELLYKKGITVNEVSKETLISKETLFAIVNNKVRKIDLDILETLSMFLECEITDLIVKENPESLTKTYRNLYKDESLNLTNLNAASKIYFVPKGLSENTIIIFLKGVQMYGDLDDESFKKNILEMFRKRRVGLSPVEIQEKGLNVYAKRRMIFDYVLAEIHRAGYFDFRNSFNEGYVKLNEKGHEFLKKYIK